MEYFCTLADQTINLGKKLKPEKNNITHELMTRLKNGVILAFDRDYELYSYKLFSFVFKFLKNEAEADTYRDGWNLPAMP